MNTVDMFIKTATVRALILLDMKSEELWYDWQ